MYKLNFRYIYSVVCAALIFWSGSLYAQLNVYYEDDAIIDTVFTMDQTGLTVDDYCFPGFNIHPSTKHAIIAEFDTLDSYEISVKDFISSEKWNSNLTLFTRVHTYNVAVLEISLVYADSLKLLSQATYKSNGFQWLIEEDLSDEMLSELPDKIQFSVSRKDTTQTAELAIGALWLGKKVDVKKVMPNPIFLKSPFTNKSLFNMADYNKEDYNSFGLYSHYPTAYYDEEFATFLEVESYLETKDVVVNILRSSLNDYPFYEEKGINKNTVINDFNSVMKETYSTEQLCDFVNVLEDFLFTTFSDPHFSIKIKNCEEAILAKGPIRLFPIKGSYRVAAIFDEALAATIPLNSKICAIDNIFLDSLDTDLEKVTNYRKILSRNEINSKLFKQVGDTVLLKYQNSETEEVSESQYVLKKKYKVPSRFRISHCTFKTLDAKTVYFKFNSIFRDIPLAFASHIDEVNMHQNLIIDLRGNTGGESEEGARLLSYLIPHDFTFTKTLNRETQQIDSTIVKRDMCFNYREDGHIVVLVDELTASAAELFTYVLKKQRKDVTIIGKSTTMGTIIPTYFLKIPESTITIQINSASPVKYVFDTPIEDIGITPDVFIETTSVYDLQPYNDTVLEEALIYLNVP